MGRIIARKAHTKAPLCREQTVADAPIFELTPNTFAALVLENSHKGPSVGELLGLQARRSARALLALRGPEHPLCTPYGARFDGAQAG